METNIQALKRSKNHILNDGATQESLRLISERLGLPIPTDFRRLYEFSDGAQLLDGNFNYWPVRGPKFSLWESREFLQSCKNVIPEEVLVFADNGSDLLFGIWLQPTGSRIFEMPIVEIGQIHEPGCMAIAGTALAPFMKGWIAYYLLLDDKRPAKALDILGLPKELRFTAEEMGDEEFARLRQWADPQLPDSITDPYKARFDAEALKRIFSENP
jgi:hypothetical protein